jgi:hypothetical protein
MLKPGDHASTWRTLAATPSSVALLAALSALGQFASTIYTPSLPAVAVALNQPIGVKHHRRIPCRLRDRAVDLWSAQ